MVPVSVTDRCAAKRLGDLSTVELLKQCSEQDVTADVYTVTVNGFGKFAMRVWQTCHTAYRPYQDLDCIDLLLNSAVTYALQSLGLAFLFQPDGSAMHK